MKYTNPIVRGFYPDPSVCCADGKYYMVCSSFQYFPGVPLFESDNLVNWRQIGHVLTRKSQVMLEKINSSGGVFAPTIRYNNGRFYMVTTNDTTHRNFYVYTDDIHGEWSEPINVEQDGIDPSLYFEDGHAYFMSNGMGANGKGAINQCEINIATGEKLSETRTIWQGTGGRYLESPHLYKINGSYYIMAAEGGTEYGHMITYAKGDGIWGPFTPYPHNPVLTNRNKAPFLIQGIGHGDIVQDKNGNYHIISLGFRQIDIWATYHTLGREVFMTPIAFDKDGWFTAGRDGTTDESYELSGDFVQERKNLYTFENTDWSIDWCYLRHPHNEDYALFDDRAVLRGSDISLYEADSPTFIGIRQRELCGEMRCTVTLDGGEAGLTAYMTENEHYDVALRKTESGTEAILKLNVGGIRHIQAAMAIEADTATLIIRMENYGYTFFVKSGDKEYELGRGESKYLSSEVCGGFTGVVLGLYAVGGTAEFIGYNYECSCE